MRPLDTATFNFQISKLPLFRKLQPRLWLRIFSKFRNDCGAFAVIAKNGRRFLYVIFRRDDFLRKLGASKTHLDDKNAIRVRPLTVSLSLSSHRIVEELASGELGQVDQGGHVRVARAEQEQVHADLKLAKLHRFILQQRRQHRAGQKDSYYYISSVRWARDSGSTNPGHEKWYPLGPGCSNCHREAATLVIARKCPGHYGQTPTKPPEQLANYPLVLNCCAAGKRFCTRGCGHNDCKREHQTDSNWVSTNPATFDKKKLGRVRDDETHRKPNQIDQTRQRGKTTRHQHMKKREN